MPSIYFPTSKPTLVTTKYTRPYKPLQNVLKHPNESKKAALLSGFCYAKLSKLLSFALFHLFLATMIAKKKPIHDEADGQSLSGFVRFLGIKKEAPKWGLIGV